MLSKTNIAAVSQRVDGRFVLLWTGRLRSVAEVESVVPDESGDVQMMESNDKAFAHGPELSENEDLDQELLDSRSTKKRTDQSMGPDPRGFVD